MGGGAGKQAKKLPPADCLGFDDAHGNGSAGARASIYRDTLQSVTTYRARVFEGAKSTPAYSEPVEAELAAAAASLTAASAGLVVNSFATRSLWAESRGLWDAKFGICPPNMRQDYLLSEFKSAPRTALWSGAAPGVYQ